MANGGSVHIDITASDKTKATVDTAKKEIRDLGAEANKAEKSGRGLGKVGDAVEGSTKSVRKFAGAITGAVGAITGMVGVVTLLVGWLVALGTNLNARLEEVLRINKAVGDVTGTLEDAQRAANRALSGVKLTDTQVEFERIEKHVRDLDIAFHDAGVSQKKLVEEIRPALAAYKQDLIDIARAARDLRELEEARNSLRQSLAKTLGDQERIEFAAAQRVATLRIQLRQTESEVAKKLIQEAIDFEFKAREAALKELHDRERARLIKDAEDAAVAYWAEYKRKQEEAHRIRMEQIRREVDEANRLQSLQQSQRFGDSNTSVLGGRTVNVKQGGDFTRSIR